MFVIVVGGGKVGYFLSRELIQSGHEVALMERDRARAAQITEEIGSIVIPHDGCEGKYLGEAGAHPGDHVAAVSKAPLEATPAVLALKEWRLARARAEEAPAYVVFNDRTLAELVTRAPRTIAELAAVPGIGPAKLERFGSELLATLAKVA